MLQTSETIAGIPPVLVSGNNARAVIETADSIRNMSALLFLVLTIIGVWMSQFKFISEKTGGPGQYVMRCATVGFSLLGYKLIFAMIMWVGALIAYQIFPIQASPTRNTVVPWLPAGSLSGSAPAATPVPTPNPNTNTSTLPTPRPTRPPFQTTSSTTVLDMILWGVNNALGLSFSALPAMIVIALCNILFVLSVFLISAFWLTFAIVLYALGPVMIIAGLIPTYGDKIWGNWIGATIQCSLWQVWMAFCGKLITSSFLIGISQLNIANRMPGSSGGGEFSGAVMDWQQASYALVFLILYLATPLVANYVFPIGASAGLGAFMFTAATAGASKVARKVAAVKTGGASEALAKGAEAGAKSGGKAAGGGITTSQRNEGGVYKTVNSGGKTKSNGGTGNNNTTQRNSTSNNSEVSYDGSKRESNYEVAPSVSNGVAGGSPGTKTDSSVISSRETGGRNGDSSVSSNDRHAVSSDTASSSAGTKDNGGNQSQIFNDKNGSNNLTSSEGKESGVGGNESSSTGARREGGQDPYGNGDFKTNVSETYESLRPEDLEIPQSKEKPSYTVSTERPSDVKFGNLPKPKSGDTIPRTSATANGNEAEE